MVTSLQGRSSEYSNILYGLQVKENWNLIPETLNTKIF